MPLTILLNYISPSGYNNESPMRDLNPQPPDNPNIFSFGIISSNSGFTSQVL